MTRLRAQKSLGVETRDGCQPGRWALWWQWALATTVGELAGFAVPAVVGSVATRAMEGMAGATQAITMLLLVTLAGIVEGATLGLAQSLVLRRYIRNLAWREWIRNTALAAGLAYILGMTPSTLMEVTTVNLIILLIVAILFIPALLASIGVAQWLVLRRYVQKAGWWVLANAIAWIAGLAMPFIGLTLVPDGSPVAAYIAAGVMSGVLMGAVVGGITGIVLVRLLEQPVS